MVFGHVLMHVRVVLSDIALRAAVGNGPESEWGGVGVWTLELQGWEESNSEQIKYKSFTMLEKASTGNATESFPLFGFKNR